MALRTKSCEHLSHVDSVKPPQALECAECVKTGSRWVHLRTCQECGITLCCDSSPNRHATRHFRAQGHPVVASAQPGEHWLWCYEDRNFLEYDPGLLRK